MKCFGCNFGDTKVIESRSLSEGEAVRRRRLCPICNERFTTYERLESPQVVVIKQNNTRELFSRDKLTLGIIRACEKTPVTKMQIDQIVSSIEKELMSCGDQEISSQDVGEMVIDQLADINEVAYVRFASVYRRFNTLAAFEEELSRIRSKRKK